MEGLRLSVWDFGLRLRVLGITEGLCMSYCQYKCCKRTIKGGRGPPLII